jgi:serralysin
MTLPVFSNDQIATQLTTGYWNYVAAANPGSGVTPNHWNVSTGGSLTVNIEALAANSKFFAIEALKTWSEVTGINFTYITTGLAQISFIDTGSQTAVTQNYFSGGFTTSAQVQISQDWQPGDVGNLNSYTYQTYLHEIGHALGLGHAGNYNGIAAYDVNLGTAGHNQYLNDSSQASIMSYFNPVFDPLHLSVYDNTWVNAGFAFVMTPMVADIIAVQSFYGISTNAHAGNTVYGFNATAGNIIFDATQITGASYTIEDSGGIDTMDYSGYGQNQVISLISETYSNVGGVVGAVTIARNTVVENAIGGSGSDTITGNAADNVLKGGAGADTLVGGGGRDLAIYEGSTLGVTVNLQLLTAQVSAGDASGDILSGIDNLSGSSHADNLTGNGNINFLDGGLGNDTLNGGSGADILVGGGGDDSYIVDNAGDVTTEVSGGGIDTVQSSIAFTLATEVENLILTGALAINGTGNSLDNRLQGNAGSNTLDGGFGNDIFVVSAGVDTLNGGAGLDTVSYASNGVGVQVNLGSGGTGVGTVWTGSATNFLNSIENAVGSAFGDILTGDALDNVFQGNGGLDYISGGAGSDTVSYAGNGVRVQVNLGANGTGSGNTWDGTSMNFLTGIENAIGTSFGDILTGDANDNIFQGNGGLDFINGGSGSDMVSFANNSVGIQVNLGANGTGNGNSWDGSSMAFLTSIESATGSKFSDILTGDALDNTFQGNGGLDFISGGGGIDTVSFATNAVGVQINLGANGTGNGNSWDGSSMAFLTSIENATGSKFSDILTGDALDNTFQGNGGLDYFNGNGGNDTVSFASSSVGVQINLGAYSTGSGNSWDGSSIAFLTSIENATGSKFSDNLTGDGNANSLNGGLGSDTLTGGLGADTFRFTDLNFGADYITDYVHGTDHLSFSTAISHLFSDFTITNNDTLNVVVAFNGGGSIVIHNTSLNHIDATDFLFV